MQGGEAGKAEEDQAVAQALYRGLKILGVGLAIAVPIAVQAQALVLRSGGPSAGRYPPGSRTPPGATFNLRPGDSLSILAGGATRSFRGPGVFNATSPSGGGALRAGARINTGAVRSGETAAGRSRTDIWQYDVTKSGRACAVAGRPLMLWRPDATPTAQLTITPQVGDARTLAWPAGSEAIAWPSDLPLTANASYQLSWSASTAPSRVTLRPLAGLDGANLEALAAAFTANRCDGQLDTLIALHADAAPARR